MDEATMAGYFPEVQSPYERAPFLTTHRARAACTRELARLSDELIARTTEITAAMETPRAIIRRPPGRCIIQLGPVALTAVWLCHSLDPIASGELMINLWRGAVSPRLHHRGERPGEEPTPVPARALWESVLVPSAADEGSWMWHPPGADVAPMQTAQLAAACIERLRIAYVESAYAAEPGTGVQVP